jgi:hypothetical protein
MSMTNIDNQEKKFSNFHQFYEFFLSEHSDPLNRRLHFAGCIIVLILVHSAFLSGVLIQLLLAPVFDYGIA